MRAHQGLTGQQELLRSTAKRQAGGGGRAGGMTGQHDDELLLGVRKGAAQAVMTSPSGTLPVVLRADGCRKALVTSKRREKRGEGVPRGVAWAAR